MDSEVMREHKVERSSTMLSHKPVTALKIVKEWKKNLTEAQAEGYIAFLSEIKEDILDKNPSVWIDEYMSSPILQEFLKIVVKLPKFRLQVQRLATSEELRHFDASTFPGVEQLFQSLYQSPNSSNFRESASLQCLKPKPPSSQVLSVKKVTTSCSLHEALNMEA